MTEHRFLWLLQSRNKGEHDLFHQHDSQIALSMDRMRGQHVCVCVQYTYAYTCIQMNKYTHLQVIYSCQYVYICITCINIHINIYVYICVRSGSPPHTLFQVRRSIVMTNGNCAILLSVPVSCLCRHPSSTLSTRFTFLQVSKPSHTPDTHWVMWKRDTLGHMTNLWVIPSGSHVQPPRT